ncbi:MAG: hypothetical protein ASARMPREDX12_004884 [Alectoria sarmentosa]|nr:MAG: hypothetical protein ASARMPREDX12_004884 [Alectoria sarmentosa]
MQEILSRLYLGDLRAAENTKLLRRNNVSFVLSIKHKNLSRATRDAYQQARISHVHIVKRDTLCEELLSILGPACDMIEGGLANGRAVLVHCALGRSRSATVMIAYIMRRMDMGCNDALQMVQSRRAMIDPNPAFLEQLDVWEKCRFDIQNRVMVDREAGTDPVGRSCTREGRERMAEGEEAKQEAERNREGKEEEETEEKKEHREEKEAEGTKGKGGSKENEKVDEEEKCIEKDENREEDGGKEEEKTKASSTAQTSKKEPDHPTNMVTGLKRACGMLAKSQEPQNIDDRSAAAGTCPRIDTAPADLPPPSPPSDVVRPAIKSLHPKFPATGKKKLLRILNAGQGWRVASKEFRSYLVTGWGPKEKAMGTETETETVRRKDVPGT